MKMRMTVTIIIKVKLIMFIYRTFIKIVFSIFLIYIKHTNKT